MPIPIQNQYPCIFESTSSVSPELLQEFARSLACTAFLKNITMFSINMRATWPASFKSHKQANQLNNYINGGSTYFSKPSYIYLQIKDQLHFTYTSPKPYIYDNLRINMKKTIILNSILECGLDSICTTGIGVKSSAAAKRLQLSVSNLPEQRSMNLIMSK